MYLTNFLFSSVPSRKKCPHGEVDLLGRARIKILLARINLAKMFCDFFFVFLFSSLFFFFSLFIVL